MFRITGLYLILVIAFAASAQSISMSGLVSNKSGKPIPGAIVTLSAQKLSDTTDAQGVFSLKKGTLSAVPSPIPPAAEKIILSKGRVLLSLDKSAPISIEIFDMQGKLLEKTADRAAPAGDYRFDFALRPLAANMIVIRVSTGHKVSCFRSLPINDNRQSVISPCNGASSSTGEGPVLARIQASIDSLKVSASGYLSKGVAISSYQGVVNITLDTMTLAKFSFFVTSLKALQDLSKSQDGFGGDFRFGKTGQGAGLLGADSICQCIAERSMPGSKAKIWRAFLSVSKDAGGKQVNAIDRIGQGPWYDRLGRVMSTNITGLLATRPAADAAIKNDLPNEDGVPNHRPDPNKPEVDNHHFATGSGTDGKLYSAGGSVSSTCLDWTTVGTDTKVTGKPHCGFSWPRGSGGSASNWISGFDAHGCKAGTELIQNGAGDQTNPIIGGGGGYGGFYCFALTP
jgi:hypothetical protein